MPTFNEILLTGSTANIPVKIGAACLTYGCILAFSCINFGMTRIQTNVVRVVGTLVFLITVNFNGGVQSLGKRK